MSVQHIIFTLVITIVILGLLAWIGFRLRRKSQTAKVGMSDEKKSKQVYVGNLSYQVGEQDLRDYFGKYGHIAQVKIVRNYGSGRSKGFGFVTYSQLEEAHKALAAHGQKYQGRTIVVRIAKPR